MAYAIVRSFNPLTAASYNPLLLTTQKVTEQGAGTTTIDFTNIAFTAARVRIYVKTPPSATNVVTFTLRVGTGATPTANADAVNIAQKKVTMQSGDTTIELGLRGFSQAPFRSLSLIAAVSANSIVFDALIEVS